MGRKIGFNWGWGNWGKSKSTATKWETSYFGGYYRLISDYPRVVVDLKMDFDFAPMKYLSYYEKEKLLKIFLSKTKTNGLINELLKNAGTTKEENFLYGTMIKTTLNENSKKNVLNLLGDAESEKEYWPLYNHYKQFIIDSSISFKRPENQDGNGGGENKSESKEKNSENKNQNQNSSGNQNSQSQQPNSQSESENQENQDDAGQNEKDKKENQSQNGKPQSGSETNSNEILNNLIAFETALNDITEEEFKWESLSTFNKKTETIILSSGSETVFTEAEKDIADNLTNLLDISFDPTEDTVKNLRLGKLDITKIAEVPAGNVAIYKQSVENQITKPFSVVILCDESGSMQDRKNSISPRRIESQYSVVKSLYLSFADILPPDKIFIYGHSGLKTPKLYVYHDLYNQNFQTTIDLMRNRHDESLNYNYDGPIIEEVHKSVRLATADRIIFILISDGRPNGYDGCYGYSIPSDIVNMKQIIEKCKRDEFVTVGIGIESFHVKDLYQYSAVVDELSDMPKKVSHIVNHVVRTEFQ